MPIICINLNGKYGNIIYIMGSLFASFWLFSLIGRHKHCLTPWSCKPRQGARVLLLFTTVWCWATTNTKECNGYTATPFRRKPFYGSNRLDPVMIRPPGIEPGGFVVSPDSVWYARVLLLFSASAATDTGSKVVWMCPCIDDGNLWRSW